MNHENEVIECALRLLMNREHTSVTLEEVCKEFLGNAWERKDRQKLVDKILSAHFERAETTFGTVYWLKK